MFFLGRPPAQHPAERGENGEKNWGVLALRTYGGAVASLEVFFAKGGRLPLLCQGGWGRLDSEVVNAQ